MDIKTLKLVIEIAFTVVVGFLAVVSLLTAYVFIKYGRSQTFATVTSMVYGGIFLLSALGAFLSLSKIF